MRALLIEAACSASAIGISPWILPLIAIAAKRKAEQAANDGRNRVLRRWLDDKRTTRSDRRARNWRILRECIKGRMAGK